MKNALVIAKKEFSSYFNSPVAYVVLGLFLLLSGYLFFSTFFLSGFASMRNYFNILPVLFCVFGPALTMRFIAEERKSGTMEHLLTLPLRESEVVFGKFLAGLSIVCVGLLFSLPYAFSVASVAVKGARFDWGPVVGGYIGLLFLASSFIALGLLASSLTRSQIVALIVGFGLCIFFWAIDKFAILLPAKYAGFFEYLSVDHHFANISRGVIDSRDIVFYLTLTIVALLLTARALRQDRN